MPAVPIAKESLRTAMRDGHYWRYGHPECQGSVDREVTRGWQALTNAEARRAAGGGEVVVRVSNYVRMRNGKVGHVSGYDQVRPLGDRQDEGRTRQNHGQPPMADDTAGHLPQLVAGGPRHRFRAWPRQPGAARHPPAPAAHPG